MSSPFDTRFGDLPDNLPLFPLPCVILLPRVTLPLNVFEPRYLAMTDFAMQGSRLIGMVQPLPTRENPQALAPVGCAGRITSFSETEDGRYLVTLKGVCRFRLSDGAPVQTGGFRVAGADWRPYASDLSETGDDGVCREAVLQTLRGYLDKMNMFCDQWEKMHGISCESLISTLSVVCAFPAAEKQALLEAKTLAERARILQAVLATAAADNERSAPCH